MGFQGYLDTEQAFQVYVRGCIDFGKTYTTASLEERADWWQTIVWRQPESLPIPPFSFPTILSNFLPHESGADLPGILHPLDWEMALIRAEAAEWPLPNHLHASFGMRLASRLSASQKDTLNRAHLAGAHFLEFRKFRALKKFAPAEDQLRLAIGQFPEAAVLKAHGAWLYLLKGHMEKALLAIDDLPLYYPAPSLQLAVRIGSLTRLGHAQQALDFWQTSAFPFPVTPELALTLALAYAEIQDMASAYFWLGRAEKPVFPPEGLYWSKALFALKENAPEKAQQFALAAENIKDLSWLTNGEI